MHEIAGVRTCQIAANNFLQIPELTPLEVMVKAAPSCYFEPFQFFVSWQGVLTLAYRGFPPSLAKLKQQLTAQSRALPPENPGSRWPKTSLGCLKEGRRLTPEQLRDLQSLCKRFSDDAKLQACRLRVSNAEVVLFECRCLESILHKHTLQLSDEFDEAGPSPAEQEIVKNVIAEADDPGYWFAASKDGNRESHYRGNALGATLCTCQGAFVEEESNPSAAVAQVVAQFREQVDDILPDTYAWFSDTSLHITIRALI